MTPKFANLEIILIYFLLLIPWPHMHVMKLLCSKDNSRLVRKIVRSKWTPILDKYQVKLPLECPLHPFRDLFSPRQDAKKRDRPTQWTCRLCGKSFYQEKFLDLHFETRHNSIKNEAEDAICLADFCDIMRCEVFQTEESSSLKTGDQHVVTEIEVWGDSLGQNSALAKANAAYLSLIPLRTSSVGALRAKVQNRQLCQDKIGQNKLKDSVDQHLNTDKLNSNNDAAMQNTGVDGSSGSSTTTTNFKHSRSNKQKSSSSSAASSSSSSATKNSQNQSDELNNNGNDTAAGNNNKTQNDSGTNGNNQKVRASCKTEELNKLKVKCEQLVRGCVGGLLLSMTDQHFKEMEEEMNKAVCWYLSCDRYWEDGPLEPRAFPWGLILILIFVLSTGICFCYYIIWILFDSEETTINANHHLYMHHQQYQHQQYPMSSTVGGPAVHGMSPAQQHYYYQQQQAHDLYPEPPQYDYRHSPRRYIAEQRQQVGTQHTPPPTHVTGAQTQSTATPLHHQGNMMPTTAVYQQDILDRRDINRGIATTAVTSGGGTGISSSSSNIGSSNTNVTTTAATATAAAAAAMDCDRNVGGIAAGSGSGGGVGGKHYNYNTHPHARLGTHHRHAGSSQQSLRGSSSSHEIIQNEIGHNEHYIYVTYPPDLKKRFFEKYE